MNRSKGNSNACLCLRCEDGCDIAPEPGAAERPHQHQEGPRHDQRPDNAAQHFPSRSLAKQISQNFFIATCLVIVEAVWHKRLGQWSAQCAQRWSGHLTRRRYLVKFRDDDDEGDEEELSV